MYTVLLFIFFLSSGAPDTQANTEVGQFEVGPFIEGFVRYPDGSPAPHAAVRAVSWLTTGTTEGAWDVVTDDKGAFRIPTVYVLLLPSQTLRFPIFPRTRSVRLFASLEEELWLRTGTDTFYSQPNGIPVEVTLSEGTPVQQSPAEIYLGARGAEFVLTVWDSGVGKAVEAGLTIQKPRVGASEYDGIIGTSTEPDGGPLRSLLPPGLYEVELDRYPCGNRTFFASPGIKQTYNLLPGERRTEVLVFDSRTAAALESFDNPLGQPCGGLR
jgi:hypothetical protein